jgi:hypothetical protein
MPSLARSILAGIICVSAAATAIGADRQPVGSLSGKIVYLHSGHGWSASGVGGTWQTQRPETFEVVEDLTNHDFVTIQAEHLWNAGATIVPLRPIGHQTREFVVDNDDPGVSFLGSWFDSAQPVFFGAAGDVPYRFAFTTPTETAVARYQPSLDAPGKYPVYAWTLGGSNRVEQVYRIIHSGGATEVTVDHRLVGGGLVYLGTFHFESDGTAAVEISNRSDDTGVVIADMIRFGNGMGDIDRGAGPSGMPRHDEAALYWIETHRGIGAPDSAIRTSSSDLVATVSAPTRWSTHMNLEAAGDLHDRVFLSHHSNAAGGTARGVIALLNGNNNPATETPNQFTLALRLASEVNDDMVAQDGRFEHDWGARTVLLLDRTDFEFGEISNLIINDEFDATIVERAFHDNQLDAELLRDARVNHAMARATVQGLIRYFDDVDPDRAASVMPPPPVEAVSAVALVDGSVLLLWDRPDANEWAGDEPTAYVIERSDSGFGFGDPVTIDGADTTLALLPPDTNDTRHYRISARNDGGESRPSKVVSVTPDPTKSRVLIVDSFDRIDRRTNVREPYFAGIIDRVIPDRQNARSYAASIAAAIDALGIAVDTVAATHVEWDVVRLRDYRAALWMLGNDGPDESALNAAELHAAEMYLALDGGLIIAGSNATRRMGESGAGAAFLANALGVTCIGESAATSVSGEIGFALEGISATIGGVFNLDPLESLLAFPTTDGVLSYSSPSGTAGIFNPGLLAGGAFTLGFPVEAIADQNERSQLLGAALTAMGVSACAADWNADGTLDGFDITTYVGSLETDRAGTDLDADGEQTFLDLIHYLQIFEEGCTGGTSQTIR